MSLRSEYEAILPSLLEYFQGRTRTFKAGSLAAYCHIWHESTSDPEILETVTGQRIELDKVPMQGKPLMQTKLSDIQTETVDLEIAQLLKKGVIQPSKHEAGEFISTIFTRPKKDGSHRMILSLNATVTHYHFKMDNIWSAIRLMKPGCYMASIDLKDAYYTVPICKEHQKFLKFKWKGSLYQFVCFPNGLALCPRKFTKLLKPIFSCLRQQGHISVAYVDDSWLTAENFTLCLRNVIDTTTLLDKVGFIVHPEKPVLLPTQRITFLGFVLKLKNACENLLATTSPCIRDVAQVLGLMTSSFPGVMYGPLHHKFLEMDKTQALKINEGNFHKNMSLSPEATTDLKWWVSELDTTYSQLKPYVAYKPDPEAHAINAFRVSWKGYTSYAFPPSSILQRVLQKISEEEATGLLVVPNWPTQIWWPYLMNMLIVFPLILPRKEDTLYLPAHPQLLHPLHKKLQLMVCHLSGISSRAEEFRLALQRSLCNPGERVHKSSTTLTTRDGECSVVQGVLIPFQLL